MNKLEVKAWLTEPQMRAFLKWGADKDDMTLEIGMLTWLAEQSPDLSVQFIGLETPIEQPVITIRDRRIDHLRADRDYVQRRVNEEEANPGKYGTVRLMWESRLAAIDAEIEALGQPVTTEPTS